MSKLVYDLGDRVRIVANGQTGSICDVRKVKGEYVYIVDCFGECDSEELLDCVITVNEAEIEAI